MTYTTAPAQNVTYTTAPATQTYTSYTTAPATHTVHYSHPITTDNVTYTTAPATQVITRRSIRRSYAAPTETIISAHPQTYTSYTTAPTQTVHYATPHATEIKSSHVASERQLDQPLAYEAKGGVSTNYDAQPHLGSTKYVGGESEVTYSSRIA